MAEVNLGSLLGGLGLFLLGMLSLTDGLKLAAGPAMARILVSSTQTRWRGLAAGVLVTALVQSSSAVTVAAIGFVNAGLLTFGQSLWVLFGANVGTTMTGWLVALIGFKIKVEAAALPLIGIGMALHVSGSKTRRGAFGQALAGFGLLFLGIGFLQQSFAGVGDSLDIVGLADGGWFSIVVMVLVGTLFTVLMQSSSAALAIVLTLAETGVLPLDDAAAAVIGANVGTTVTALLAVIGATANARRAASAHVLFNLLTGIIALLLLPILLQTIAMLSSWLKLDTSPAVALAMFHTIFNVLGVLLMLPMADRLAQFLSHRFVSHAEEIGAPRYLDRHVATVPALAVVALDRELIRFGGLACLALRKKLGALEGNVWQHGDTAALLPLGKAIGEFVTQVNRGAMAESTAEQFVPLLRRQRYFAAVVELLPDIAEATGVVAGLPERPLGAETAKLLAEAVDQVRLFDPEVPLKEVPPTVFPAEYETWKFAVLEATARGEISVETMDILLRGFSALRRVIEQLRSAALVSLEPVPH